MNAFPFIAGIYLCVMAVTVKVTEGSHFGGNLLFKWIPGILGIGCLIFSAKLFGWV